MMTRTPLYLIVGSLMLSGCSSTATQSLADAPDCKIVKVPTCWAASALNNQATFGHVVDALQFDQQALQRCADETTKVYRALEQCHQQTEAYKQQLKQAEQHHSWLSRLLSGSQADSMTSATDHESTPPVSAAPQPSDHPTDGHN